jgi:two-component system, NarL family, nitrate/nitrite response regulator NarL
VVPPLGGGAIRIELVDDHALVRSGLRLLIERHQGFTVVAEAGTAAEAVAAAGREHPDVILLDLDLGRDNGLDCLPRLREAAPNARILVLTGLQDPEAHQQAVRLGAFGVLTKEKAAESVTKAIERVHAGEIWLDRTLTANLLTELATGGRPKASNPEGGKLASLTSRERDVIAVLLEGLHNKEIAERLHLSESTVRHHLTSIFEKLHVPDRLSLTIYAFRHGLAPPVSSPRVLMKE